MSGPWTGCIYPHPADETCPGCSGEYDTPRWERVLLWIVLALMVVVMVSAIASMIVPAVRS